MVPWLNLNTKQLIRCQGSPWKPTTSFLLPPMINPEPQRRFTIYECLTHTCNKLDPFGRFQSMGPSAYEPTTDLILPNLGVAAQINYDGNANHHHINVKWQWERSLQLPTWYTRWQTENVHHRSTTKMHMCTHAIICIILHIYIYTCVCACMCIYVNASLKICIYILHLHIDIFLSKHACYSVCYVFLKTFTFLIETPLCRRGPLGCS